MSLPEEIVGTLDENTDSNVEGAWSLDNLQKTLELQNVKGSPCKTDLDPKEPTPAASDDVIPPNPDALVLEGSTLEESYGSDEEPDKDLELEDESDEEEELGEPEEPKYNPEPEPEEAREEFNLEPSSPKKGI